MKRRILAAALTAALLLSLASCGLELAVPTPSATPSPTPVPTPTPVPPAERVFALACYPEDSFHPITGQNRANLLLAPLVYRGLFALDSSFTPQKQLCAEYSVSEDGLTWTFTLADAVFSDGSALTAADAAASLKLAMGKTSVYAARLANVSKVAAAKDGTLAVTLKAPNGSLPALLDIPIVREAEAGLPPLGTGDYAFERDEEEGWRLRRVTPLPAGSQAPEVIPLRSIRQTDDLIHAFDTQSISLVSTDPTGTNPLGYSGSFETWEYSTATMLYIGFNSAKGPCSDPKVRQALSYGFDRTAVANAVLSGHAAAAELPVSPLSPLYDATLAVSLRYSHQTMADLLEDAGWRLNEDGVRMRKKEALSLVFLVNMENSAKLTAAEHLAQGLERAGLSVTLKKLSWEDYTTALKKGDFDLYLAETRLTADFDLSALAAKKGALNYGRFDDELTDELLARFLAAGELERPAAASALYVQLANAAPFVPLCFKKQLILTGWGALAGLTPTQQNVFFGFDRWRF